ncbi:MAG: hypothetical protein ACPGYX_07075 [Oceanobacter sp.]
MKLNRFKSVSLNSQTGVGLPLALFVLVIMSMIAIQVVDMNQRSLQSMTHDLSSAKAWYAAEGAAQIAVSQSLATTPCQCPFTTQTQNFTVDGLQGCDAQLSCEVWTTGSESLCVIQSRGRCDGGNATRSVEVRLR